MLRDHGRGDEAGFRRKNRAQVPDPEAAPEGENDLRNRHSQESGPRQRRRVSRVLRERRLRLRRPGNLQEKGECLGEMHALSPVNSRLRANGFHGGPFRCPACPSGGSLNCKKSQGSFERLK